MSKRAAVVLVLFFAACSSTPPGPVAMADFPNLSNDRVLRDIVKLSSDEFEGRQPGSKGEKLTTDYLIKELKDWASNRAIRTARGHRKFRWSDSRPSRRAASS